MKKKRDFAQVVKEAKNGKQKAWKEIYEMMFDRVYRFVRGRLKNFDPAVAEDLTANSFLKFFENLENIDETKNPSSYLMTIAVNEVRKFLIKESRFVPINHEHPQQHYSVEDKFMENRRREAVNQFYEVHLTDEEKDVLSLKFGGLTYKEIGEVMGVSERTIKRKVKKILVKAEKFFEKEGLV